MALGHRTIRLVLLLIGAMHAASVCAAEPATQPAPPTPPTGTIKGAITSPGEVPLSEMVVYLVADDGQQIIVPKDVAKVSQKNARFAPPLVIVCVGQSVDFLNDEDRQIEHNVFSNSPTKQFDLGLYKPGESRAVTFDKPGPVFLYCSIHRHMDGVIYVTPTPFYSRVDADGKYQIDNVPPGHWVVWTWQRRRRFQEAHEGVKVQAGETVVQDLALLKK
jgi:plastocyanin